MTNDLDQHRECDGSGRFRPEFNRSCRCGCPLGDHAALAHKPCLVCGKCDGFKAKPLTLRERILSSGKVAKLWSETGHRDDGRRCWWVHYLPGWESDLLGSSIDHEDTLTDLWRRVRAARKGNDE